MKRTTQLLGAVSAVALIAVSSTPAMAEGIRAGTDITNTVTVDYQVNGVDQTQETATDTFAVDRRVNVTVSSVDSPKDVNPGTTDGFLTFDVTNLSNDTVDLDLTATLEAGDTNDIGAFTIYEDTNNNGTFDAADQVITFLDEVEADETLRVFVVADIDLAAENGDSFDISLNADAHEAGGVGALGTELSESTGDSADPSVVDTVLADGSNADGLTGDVDNDGSFSAQGTLNVAGADVTVIKSSVVVSDPVNGTTNPKAIPGAVIRYCIAVTNAAGAADATNIVVVDNLPGDVDYNTGTILRDTDVAVAGSGATAVATCTNGSAPTTAAEGSFDSANNRVSGSLSTISGGNSAGLSFEVTIPAATAPTP
ncbi:MAG: hypothetical protein SXU28_14140 [Pseudomonadota bacterium]|nr:hypothetical protein [Pseudomonadota bacterium]